ncbi:MAG: drug efflux transport system permease protein [Acidobacteriota bacterium]|nr:drug efflux transport system permease protein [Acidobacteriota bacterium]
MHELLAVIVKEFLQLRQDKKMIPAMIIGPLVQLLALGYAANLDVAHVPMVLVDQDRSPASRALVERFTGAGTFDLVGAEDGPDAVDPWLVEGRAQIALVIAPGYGEAVAAGRPPRVQVIADGTDANSSGLGLGYAAQILAGAGAEMAASRRVPGMALARTGRYELVPRVWYNPDLKSRWFYVPAVLAMVLMLVTMILPSMAVVREKEIGTLEQLSVTPLRSWQLILGKLTPFLVMGMLDMLLVTGLITGLFHVPLRGSLLLLAFLTFLFLLTTLGLGLLVSTLVRTQQQAMGLCIFVLMVPMIYLSGLIFPVENMPRGFQIASYAIPVRYYANVLRGIFLKGSGLDILWPEALALLGIGLTVLTLASLRFRKSLE